MWHVDDIEATPQLDFAPECEANRLGRRTASQVASEGSRLCNLLELVEFKRGATQVEICVGCGFSGCSPGGWVAVRRIGERVVWLPAWDEMEKGGWEMFEFSPPSYMKTQGTPLFSRACWDRLRGIHDGVPRLEELPPIGSRGAARLCQWSAPGGVLGEFPAEPRLRRDMLVIVTEGEVDTEADAIDDSLQKWFRNPQPMRPVPADCLVSPIEFWLDLPRNPAWQSFGRLQEGVCCLVDQGLVLVPES